jgi:hypothetical protein
MKTALITGASSGIGKELAIIFAQNKINSVLVARNINKLNELANFLSEKYHIKTIALNYDLAVVGNDEKLFKKLKSLNINIDFLVNNAGFGNVGEIEIEKLDIYTQMINLNITALSRLCIMFFDEMKKKKAGKILNIASTAAFQPIPLFNIYAATKSYVLSFSEALHFEAKPYNIGVTVVCPGPTKTNFGNVAGFKFKEKNNSKNLSAQKVASIAFDAMMKNKMTVTTGFTNQVAAFLAPKMPFRKIIPATIYKNFKKMLKKNEKYLTENQTKNKNTEKK